jgi:hypothetical protein
MQSVKYLIILRRSNKINSKVMVKVWSVKKRALHREYIGKIKVAKFQKPLEIISPCGLFPVK